METDQKIPVFFHIPKNAGTYFINRSFAFSVAYNKKSDPLECNKRLDIKSCGQTVYRLICLDHDGIIPLLSYFTHVFNNKVYEIDLKDCSRELFDMFDIFCISVCGKGFFNYEKELYPLLPYESSKFKIISLRDTFSRLISLYSYSNNEQSSHDEIHGKFNRLSFDEYIHSKLFEDSWLIRLVNFGHIDLRKKIEKKHFDKACLFLDDFDKIINYKDILQCVIETYSECYDINNEEHEDVLNHIVHEKNETLKKLDLKLSDLTKETRKLFLKQTKWETMIIDKYIKKPNIKVLLYGNCQMSVIASWLNQFKNIELLIPKNYGVKTKHTWDKNVFFPVSVGKDAKLISEALEDCDVFIFNHTERDCFVKTKYLYDTFKSQAVCICVTNFYFDAYDKSSESKEAMVESASENIKKLKTKSKINKDFYKEDYLDMAPWIEENWSSNFICSEPRHPRGCYYNELSQKIRELIPIDVDPFPKDKKTHLETQKNIKNIKKYLTDINI